MADFLRRRLLAARIGVPVIAAGLVAGLPGKASGNPADLDATASRLIGGSQIKNRSLTLRDFKRGQIFSQRQTSQRFLKLSGVEQKLDKLNVPTLAEIGDKFIKIDELGLKLQALGVPTLAQVGDKFLKIDELGLKLDGLNVPTLEEIGDKFIKIDELGLKLDGLGVPTLAEIEDKFLKIDELGLKLDGLDVPTLTEIGQKFLKLDGTAANAQKLDGLGAAHFVQGGGSVLSNVRAVEFDKPPVTLLRAEGIADVLVSVPDNNTPALRIANTGEKPPTYVFTVGTSTVQATLAPGQQSETSHFFGGTPKVATVQLIGGAVSTFTVSARPGEGDGQEFVGQGLVGG